jgi:hypothetical protein
MQLPGLYLVSGQEKRNCEEKGESESYESCRLEPP